MVVHALAFVLYIAVVIVATTTDKLTHAKDYYFHWIICAVFADASYFCFFIVLWHLGTKEDSKV